MANGAFTDESFQPPAELEAAWHRHPEIVKIGDPVLREVAKPVTRVGGDTQKLIERMTAIMREAHGVGLAAPQIGVSLRVIVYDPQDGKGLRVLVNPKIVDSSGEQTEPQEGCLSIPGLQGVVPRAKVIRVRGFDARNRPVSFRATDFEARVIQHELDHLDGILFIDRAHPETLDWILDDETEEESALRE